MSGPLAGIRVIEVGHMLAGPYCGLLLADMGAEVIKIEPPEGDIARKVSPHFVGPHNAYFASLNRNKKSVVLDLASSEGRAELEAIARDAHALITNLRPSAIKKLGLTYQGLRECNPKIVCVALTGYGLDGPFAENPAYDYVIQAVTGVMALTGDPSAPPTKAGYSAVDNSAGIMAAMGLLAKIVEGRGGQVDVSMHDVMMSQLNYLAGAALNTGEVVERLANSSHPYMVPAQIFPTADGWLTLFITHDKFWQKFCVEVGQPGWIDDPMFATMASRRAEPWPRARRDRRGADATAGGRVGAPPGAARGRRLRSRHPGAGPGQRADALARPGGAAGRGRVSAARRRQSGQVRGLRAALRPATAAGRAPRRGGGEGGRLMREPLDRHALGKALTALANAGAAELLRQQPPPTHAHHARRIGLTGAPGAGKSTLAGRLALHRARDQRIGVLAVDPSSPKSGGAILGDRIRMDELDGSAELYIRSIGSRSTSDGLSDNLPEMLDLMDAHGFDEVLLETVGVGQAEYAARVQVDTLVLVLLPESGDIVQAMKAGIMEMADIFVVNKADLPGAQKMATDIKRISAMARHIEGDWRPTVLLASATQPDSIAALSAEIDRHQAWFAQAQRRAALVQERARYRLRRLIERRTAEVVAGFDAAALDAPLRDQLRRAVQAIAAGE